MRDPLVPDLPLSDVYAAGLFLRLVDEPRWLLLRSTARHREWGFPKGHLDPGETLLQAALRECAEETGIALVSSALPAQHLTYTVSGGRSKTVVYFPAFTACRTVTLSDEHDSARWATAREVTTLISHGTLRSQFLISIGSAP